jgi:transcriptional regulator with XRE-family HTH domain
LKEIAMSRRARPQGFGERMQALRKALGRRGEETTMRGFAKELGMNPQGYRYWEKPGSYPGHSKLAYAIANVASVKQRKLDPSRLAVWLETGQGDPPWLEPVPAVTASSTAIDLKNVAVGDVDHRTPWRLLVTLADLAQHGKQDEIKNLLGILGPVAQNVLKGDSGPTKTA